MSTKSMKDKKGKPKKSIGFLDLYRYAERDDWIYLTVGILTAITAGAILIISFELYSEAMNAFVEDGRARIRYVDGMKVTFGCINGKQNNTVEFVNQSQQLLEEEGEELDFDEIQNKMNTISWKYLLYGIGEWLSCVIYVYCFSHVATLIIYRIKLKYFRSLLRHEIGWHDTHSSGELISHLTQDIEQISAGIGSEVGILIHSVTTFLAAYFRGFIMGWKMTLVLCSLMPILLLLTSLLGIVIKKATEKELKAYSFASSIAEEVISSVRTVVAFGGILPECERYGKNLTNAKKIAVKKSNLMGLIMGMIDLIFFLTFAIAFYYGGKLTRDECDDYDIGSVMAIFITVIVGTFTLGHCGQQLPTFAQAKAAGSELYKTIDRKPKIDNFPDDDKSNKEMNIGEIEGKIEFRNVSFNYPSRKELKILDDLTLIMEPGRMYALVGESGCGKSTLFQLLLKFYRVTRGEIFLDDKPLDSLELNWIRDNIGLVSQEPILFATSIKSNIQMNCPSATEADVIEVCKQANIHDFINSLPDKYETVLGERGAKLSGGQKQRIAIARALIKQPKVLLLDEATSALDTESEKIVQAAIDKASKGRTTIVIAHRLSTIRNADIIIGIEKGRVVESGSHDELFELKKLYYNLLMAQEKNEEEKEDGDDDDDVEGDGNEKKDFVVVDEEVDEEKQKFRERQISKRSSGLDSVFSSLNEIGVYASSHFSNDGRPHYTQLEWDIKEKEDVKRIESIKEKSKVKSFLKHLTNRKKKSVENSDEELPSIKQILQWNAPEKNWIILGTICSLIAGAIRPFLSYLFSNMLDSFVQIDVEEQKKQIRTSAGWLVGIGLGAFVTKFASGHLFGRSGEELTSRLRTKYFKSILRQEVGWFDREENNIGTLIARLATDATMVKQVTGIRIGVIVETIATLVGTILLCYINGPILATVLFLFFPLIILSGKIQGAKFSKSAKSEEEELLGNGRLAMQAIDNIRIVYSMNAQNYFYDAFDDHAKGSFDSLGKSSLAYGAAYGLSQSIRFFMFPVAFAFGAYLVRKDHLEFNDIFLVFSSITLGLMNIGRNFAIVGDYSKAKMAASRIISVIDRKPLLDSLSESGYGGDEFKELTSQTLGKRTAQKLSGDISIHNIRFRYPTRNKVKVLRGINLKMASGEKIALVGGSGCGKSTIIQLLERFYDPHCGHIYFDGRKSRSINIQWLRSQIGLVQQEPTLFNRTIRENIAYSLYENSRSFSMDEVVRAAKQANIHDFISGLPMQYETNVGSKGVQLSGGQKQRIAIARALITEPSILLLDEATSALDTQSQQIVQETLDEVMKGRTSICVAHRLQTIKDSDRIYVLGNGRVIESGTHDELVNKDESAYKNMYNLQQI
ncbi:hypothetical protein SNEBB_005666 [Seison nebaliae]|nr:hypothetical protein SNEBB_005666 [Seison nebaliae]